ncbi:MAG TPA: DNA-processing protein DprA, partial [Bacteroidota bacterium]|nr:DNA-processing protein DprA [Bacteroidota bacterium]
MNVDPRDILIVSRIPGVGPNRLRSLFTGYGSAARISAAPQCALRRIDGIDGKTAASIASFFRSGAAAAAARFADDQMARCGRAGAHALTLWDPGYPSSLRNIFDPPPLLFVRGSLCDEDTRSVAVVGTRRPSPYGLVMAERFAASLGALGLTVVSGLARGIDSAAHAASVRSGNRTLAVIGSGIDVIYPSENRGLAGKISSCGALITELPFGAKPDAANFPRRNRIVAGISLATLVIETAPGGGAMITAGIALDQGREVFALPSAVSSCSRSGTNLLIKEGKAKLTETVDDILVELAPRLSPPVRPLARKAEPDVTLFERTLLDAMGDDPQHIDPLAAAAHMTPSDALVHLLSLEFKGAV